MAFSDTFTAEVPKNITETDEFLTWAESIDFSVEVKLHAFFELVDNLGVITNVKDLDDGLYEKKWKSGLRVYFSIIKDSAETTLLILGSGKGRDQERAIARSRKILNSYDISFKNIRKRD